jgi:hypothetical protein
MIDGGTEALPYVYVHEIGLAWMGRRLLSLLAALLVCTVLEAHLTEWHAERDRYAAAMPSEVREVAALFDDWSRHDPNRAAAPSR